MHSLPPRDAMAEASIKDHIKKVYHVSRVNFVELPIYVLRTKYQLFAVFYRKTSPVYLIKTRAKQVTSAKSFSAV